MRFASKRQGSPDWLKFHNIDYLTNDTPRVHSIFKCHTPSPLADRHHLHPLVERKVPIKDARCPHVPAACRRDATASMSIPRNSVFRHRIDQILPMENEKPGKDDDDGADDDLGVGNIAEENEAQYNRPDKQAVLQRS